MVIDEFTDRLQRGFEMWESLEKTMELDKKDSFFHRKVLILREAN